MFINIEDCTVTPPIDCEIPLDRLKRVPVARTDSEKPTPTTERLLRYKMTLRSRDIRELEAQGPIPKNPEKVKELHRFAVAFRKDLPDFYRKPNPDIKWDIECPYVPTDRELLSYMIDMFLLVLHRPYIFTREESQRQVYESALAILDSQDRLYEVIRAGKSQFYIAVTFPTFDAAVLLAVVLVSNPERYQSSFPRAYGSLNNALDRLNTIGSVMPLAQTGAEILYSTLLRVVQAQERTGYDVQSLDRPHLVSDSTLASRNVSSSLSPDSDSWSFEMDRSAMDWTIQNPDLSEFDFSNLEVPMPLKELLLDNEMVVSSGLNDPDSIAWTLSKDHEVMSLDPSGQSLVDLVENPLWSFLTGYSMIDEN
jgi:hypothetical protein